MRLLLDQGLPRSAAALLRSAGHDTVHTGEVGMAEAQDTEILEHARAEGRVVVTLDADFHAHLALSGASMPSVIRLRVEGLKAIECAALVSSVVSQCEQSLLRGCVLSVDRERVRVRRLPLSDKQES